MPRGGSSYQIKRRVLRVPGPCNARERPRRQCEARRGEEKRREEKRRCSRALADVRTDRSPSQISSGTVLVLRAGRPTRTFFSSVCTFTEAILTSGVLIISHPFLSVRPLLSYLTRPSLRRAFGVFNLIGIDALDRVNRASTIDPHGR